MATEKFKAPLFRPVPRSTLDAWAYRLREAQTKANEALKAYRLREDYLTAYCRRNSYSADAQRDKFGQDYALSDAYSSLTFWRGEIQRYANMIDAEYKLRLMTAA